MWNNLKHLKIFFTAALILASCGVSYSQNDTLKVYWLNPIMIETSGQNKCINHQIEKDSYIDIFSKNGFSLISKGSFFAKDVYSDGFKRGDINVVIDGERYHNACPNRMDPPLTRANPISMSLISLYKTNSTLQSGFAGSVEFIRNKPVEKFVVKTGITGSQGYSETFDGYANVNYKNNAAGFRYSFGKPYRDGDNRDFKTLYSYKDNYSYSFAEATLNGKAKNIDYGASFSRSDKILFPYLQMDEIYNNVVSANFKYKSYKIYFNYTDHLMTNQLRSGSSVMETKADNFTLGAFNQYLEFYFRNWISDNKIAAGNTVYVNKAIPNLRQYSLTGKKDLFFDNFGFNLKIGGIINTIGSENNDFYKLNYTETNETDFFYRVSLSGSYAVNLNKNIVFSTLLEFSSEAPEAENLYIAIRRPGNNPWWSGNPGLANPSRFTARANLGNEFINLEMYGNYIYNYVNLVDRTAQNRNFLTYDNINAWILGANISLNYRYVSSEISYTYGQNVTSDIPLSEIAPLRATTTVYSPEIKGMNLFLTHVYNNAQKRVDETINESASETYNVFNFGINYKLKKLYLSLEARNIFNETYYNFLSYARNPYSSGAKVYEPGINFVLGILYSF
jgi:iron complex outermembrane receptor protein